MRIIGGSAGGRRIVAPQGSVTRPTSDRAREAIFNSLAARGLPDGLVVVDAWCGSGAMGIEALSRGAARAIFVEVSPGALDAVRQNLATCGVGDRATLVRADALEWLGRTGGAGPDDRFDLLFADPPYEFDDWQLVAEASCGWACCSWVVAESDRQVDLAPSFSTVRTRRYGRAWITLATASEGLPVEPSPSAPPAGGPTPDDPWVPPIGS